MKEAEMINEAYAADVKASYARFSADYLSAAGNAELLTQAEAHFKRDLANAKKVKERALSVMLGI